VPEVAGFLKVWRPEKGEQQRQTVTALAQELRTAVGNDPQRFAADADEFVGAKPIYIRRLLEGLQNAAGNLRNIEWANALKLIEYTLAQHDQAMDPATLLEGDDKSWDWARMAAAETLAAGLRQGAKGIPFEHAGQVERIVLDLMKFAPKHPELADFEKAFRRSPYFTALATLRGIAVELCVLLLWWLSRDKSGPIGSKPQSALENLPEIRQALDAQLSDQTRDGWVPRAIVGRWLRYVCYFGEPWLKAAVPSLFPIDDNDLRQAAWWSHIGHDDGPLAALMTELHSCYAESIERLSEQENDREFRDVLQNRLAEYIITLHLWGTLPDDLLEQFCRRASDSVRRHVMWFVGNEVSRPASEVRKTMKARGFEYWERRLQSAIRSSQPENFRGELGAISHWCFHGQAEEEWLCEQLLRMLRAGFAPNDAYNVVEWLQKIAPRRIDRAVEVMQPLLRHPRTDRWAYITQREPIRAVLTEGLASGTTETIQRVKEIIGFLSTVGETSYLDLVRPAAE
jgi:hypothetical protein